MVIRDATDLTRDRKRGGILCKLIVSLPDGRERQIFSELGLPARTQPLAVVCIDPRVFA